MKLKQIVVSIENAPGRLLDVTSALGQAGINLRALNLVDTGAFGQLRLLVSNVAKARRILMEMAIPAYVNEVVAAEIEDKPGSLADILRPLKEANVQVIFTYAFIGFSQDKAVMIFRFSDNDKAVEVLHANGVNLLDADSFGILENES
ncbi:MAG: amino acid-binding protein [bacterium]|nr:amino acid-binding protein [bacterium]